MLSGKLRQAIYQATNRKGGGCLLPDYQCKKTGDRLQRFSERSTRTCVFPPVEKPVCTAFKEYWEVPETVPFDFTKDDVTWVASKLSGVVGALGAEATELRNWLLRFGCAPEELRVVVSRLADWMANSSPPWAAYCAIIACRLVALDKSPGVRPVGIGETLRQALAKILMRAAEDQANTVCGNLRLCVGLEVSIKGATRSIGQRRL